VKPAVRSGNELLCSTLEILGVEYVFGVPGSETVGLYDALRKSRLRSVLTTHELAATFMANGYARVAGRVGIVFAIPGPGFTYALAGLAEARHDSIPLLLITGTPAAESSALLIHQAVDQVAMARPVVKEIVEVKSGEALVSQLAYAHALALEGEPGPVLVQISAAALAESLPATEPPSLAARVAEPEIFAHVAQEFTAASRPLILAGQGTARAARELRAVVERWKVPVLTTPAGRGVLPESHPFALRFDGASGNVAVVNELLQRADYILAVGCKLSHNGTAGFSLVLPRDRLVHVDTAPAVLNATYPARRTVQASAKQVLEVLSRRCANQQTRTSEWPPGELTMWRDRLRSDASDQLPEPRFPDLVDGTALAFFGALRRALPDDGILVTDSGTHQFLARRHFEVRVPHGLIFPNDFQAMGYGLPAAIGVKLAALNRRVVLVIGDGGLLVSGMELVTAVRERLPLTIIVFNDGQLNHIRLQQLAQSGQAHSVSLRVPDLATLATAMGLRYVRLAGDAERILAAALMSLEPILIEVRVADSPAIRLLQAKAATRRAATRVLGPRMAAWIKQRLSRPT